MANRQHEQPITGKSASRNSRYGTLYPDLEGISASTSLLRHTDEEPGVHLGEHESDTGVAVGERNRETWNSPRINAYRYLSVNLSFFVMGMHDGSIGALLPYIGKYYGVDYATISTIFVVPFLGYVTAALTSNWIHCTVGQRGIAFMGPLFRLLGYVPVVFRPPFPMLPILFMFTGFGSGIEDSGYNAWVGNMHQTNELLGILHGAFGLGGTVAPIVASFMVAKLGMPWYYFYCIFIAIVSVELVFGLWAFWGATGKAHREKIRHEGTGEVATTATIAREPVVWIIAIFLLFYAGAEVSLGGWIPTFMMEERHADGFLAGITATCFWLGLSLGRMILGFVTGRIGERLAITTYLLLCIVFQLIYWLVPSMAGAMVSVSLLGFFLGPLFPAAIVVATKILPPEYHVSAIGFSSAIGGGGAAILPFVVGAIAEGQGVGVLQPIVLVTLMVLIAMWLVLPNKREDRKGGQA